jgi:hypothetical protein
LNVPYRTSYYDDDDVYLWEKKKEVGKRLLSNANPTVPSTQIGVVCDTRYPDGDKNSNY